MSFLSTSTTTQLVVDRSPHNELLKLNFNVRCGPAPAPAPARVCPHGAREASRKSHMSAGLVEKQLHRNTESAALKALVC
jgi:hypothetical protein